MKKSPTVFTLRGFAIRPSFFIDNDHLQTRKRHPALDLPNKERHKVSIPIHVASRAPQVAFFLPDESLMKAVIRTLILVPAVIAFAFQRADVANRIDYVEEDSVF
ncbi:hypothetical protein LHY41_000388 [Salmonella enterica]|nr:hypothetical protein [Salmonella enterica]EII9564217.1 hypothetical protein [Salmonella enterica]